MSRGIVTVGTALMLLLFVLPPGPLTASSSSVAPRSSSLYSVSQHLLPSGSSGPSQITSDSSGRIWFVEQGSNQVGSFNPSTGVFSEFNIPTPNALPEGIAVDGDGNVWFAELNPNALGELFPSNGSIRELSIPPGPFGLGCGPIGVTPHGGGSIWFTCEFSNQIGEFVLANSSITEFDLPVIFSAPLQILFDSSGNLWFPAADMGMLGYATLTQMLPGTSEGIDEFPPLNSTYVNTIENSLLPSGKVETSLAIPSQIAFAPDGRSLWISEHGAGSFDRYDIVTKTLTKYFTSPPSSSLYSQSLPNGIAVDQLGNVWVAEHYGNRIAELDPSTGSMVEYPIPCCGTQIAAALYLTTGANGTVWFTENSGNAIGELRPIEGSTPTSASASPNRISMDSNGGATVTVEVTPGKGGTGESQTLSPEVEGVKRNGNLMNLTASFQPGNVTLESSPVTLTLNLKAAGLRPGVYYLTVGLRSSSTGVISSAVLEVTVSQGFETLWVATAVTVVAAVAVLLLLLRRESGRRRRRERPTGSP